jgi:type IV secretion system protein VirB10
MNTLCSLLLAIDLTLGGACVDDPDPAAALSLPADDREVWDYTKPPPPPPPPSPPEKKSPPPMPPVVIEKTIIKHVPAPAPVDPILAAAKPVPTPPPPKKENPYRAWLEAKRLRPHPTTQKAVFVEANYRLIDTDTTDAAAIADTDTDAVVPMQPSPEPPPAPQSQPQALTPKNKAVPMAPPAKGKYDHDKTLSSLPVDNGRIVTNDRYITGFLETGINSQLSSAEGGEAIVQVARDVFGHGTRNILIPKGSRMVCDYETAANIATTRIGFKCYRILLANDTGRHTGRRVEIYELESRLGDMQGRGGVTGYVNEHFGKQYGTAIGLSAVSALVRGAGAYLTVGTSDVVADIADKASQELGQRFGEITASVLEKTLAITPTITIPQGTRVQIRPKKDWYLREIL